MPTQRTQNSTALIAVVGHYRTFRSKKHMHNQARYIDVSQSLPVYPKAQRIDGSVKTGTSQRLAKTSNTTSLESAQNPS